MYKGEYRKKRNENGEVISNVSNEFTTIPCICESYNLSYNFALKFCKEHGCLVKIGRLSRVNVKEFRQAFLSYTVS